MEIDFDDDTHNIIEIHKVHTRGHKCITRVTGIPQCFDLKKILRFWKKNFKVNGHIQEEGKVGKDRKWKLEKETNDNKPIKEEIIMSGDQRENIRTFLTFMGISTQENIREYGS